MPKFSDKSLGLLRECHSDLINLFQEVIKHYDCTVLCGQRTEEEQNELFRAGKSKLQYPESKHNGTPSMAVDVVPYPIDWSDSKRFYHFMGFVTGIASQMGIKIRCGGDWDMDNNFKDQTFHDLPHVELLGDLNDSTK